MPEVFKVDLNWVTKQFPDGVKFDHDDFTTEFLNEIPVEVSVAISFAKLASGIDNIVERLNIIIETTGIWAFNKANEFSGE